MNVKPQEAVFLDDIGSNLKGAASVGIQTILVKPKQSEDAIIQLEKILNVNLLSNKSKL